MPKDLVLFFKNLLYLRDLAAAVAPDVDLFAETTQTLCVAVQEHGEQFRALGDEESQSDGALRTRLSGPMRAAVHRRRLVASAQGHLSGVVPVAAFVPAAPLDRGGAGDQPAFLLFGEIRQS
jgi:hypothetical protein